MDRVQSHPAGTSAWPRRLLGAAALVLLPLFVFGGSVTTLGAGMAVDGWWNAEGHFMPLFPLEKWFRDLNTFVEHSHRQFGMLIGLLMVAATVVTLLRDRRRSARVLVSASLLAVCFQGYLGGSRVLENSPQLAFLHGTFAQGVFALLCAAFVHQSLAWREAPRQASVQAHGLRASALTACVIVFLQIALGAWYRHTLRTGLAGEAMGRLGLHLVGAFAALGAILVLAARFQAALADPAQSAAMPAAITRVPTRLRLLLGVQFALGFVAFALHGSVAPGQVQVAEWAMATLHVLVGAMLLAQVVIAGMWSWRAFHVAPRSQLEAATGQRGGWSAGAAAQRGGAP